MGLTQATPWHGSYRNDVVAALSGALFVPYAAPNGKVFVNAVEALRRGQTVITFDDGVNRHLIDAGAKPTGVEDLVVLAKELTTGSARSGFGGVR